VKRSPRAVNPRKVRVEAEEKAVMVEELRFQRNEQVCTIAQRNVF
jgi:hypothetical protein